MTEEEAEEVVVLTGGTSGIGRAAALRLARRGATVAVVGRDEARGRAVAAEADAGDGDGTPGRIEFHRADLADLGAVRDLAATVRTEYDDLDALVHNAGVASSERRESADGYELTFAVNHLAPYLLTHELVGRLRASAPSRVVVTASGVHARADYHADDLQLEDEYDGLTAYARSKLGNVAFTLELAERLAGTGVVANCLHPGFVRGTRIWQTTSLRTRLATRLLSLVPGTGTDVAEAGGYLARLVAHDAFGERTGCYVNQDEVAEPAADARDPERREWLWEVSADLVGVDPDWPAIEGAGADGGERPDADDGSGSDGAGATDAADASGPQSE